jgi:hypothetical protein
MFKLSGRFGKSGSKALSGYQKKSSSLLGSGSYGLWISGLLSNRGGITMKKTLAILLAVLACLSLVVEPLPLMAQEMAPPPQLNDALWESLTGDWEGWSESPMGKTEDKVEIEWGLQRQFLIVRVTTKTSEAAYKMTGYSTIDSKTGKIMGYWFDSFRNIYKSTETREGNKFTIKWEGPQTFERTYEKAGNDKLVGTFKDVDPSGKVVEGRTEMTRKIKGKK